MNLKKCWGKHLLIIIFSTFLSGEVYSKTSLESILSGQKISKPSIKRIHELVAKNPKDSIRVLLNVAKNKQFPDRSRWLSLILVGKTMGKRSIPLMVKYLKHRNWMLRSAAVKSLKSLRSKTPTEGYRALLKDSSYVIRQQALDAIATLKIYDLKLDVLKMIGDSSNYIKTPNGKTASQVVKKVIETLATLKVREAIPLLKKLKSSNISINVRKDIDKAIKNIRI